MYGSWPKFPGGFFQQFNNIVYNGMGVPQPGNGSFSAGKFLGVKTSGRLVKDVVATRAALATVMAVRAAGGRSTLSHAFKAIQSPLAATSTTISKIPTAMSWGLVPSQLKHCNACPKSTCNLGLAKGNLIASFQALLIRCAMCS